MSKVSRFSGVRAVTAELTIEYLKPIRVDQEIIVEGFSARREGRQLYHEGEIRNAAGASGAWPGPFRNGVTTREICEPRGRVTGALRRRAARE